MEMGIKVIFVDGMILKRPELLKESLYYEKEDIRDVMSHCIMKRRIFAMQ